MHLPLIAALAACDPNGSSTAPTAPFLDTGLTPIAWTFEPPPPAPDNVDLGAVEAALTAAIDAILVYDARAILDRYVERYETSATPACPGAVLDPYGNRYWSNGCVAADGTLFAGYLSEYVYTDLIDGDMVLNGEAVSGVITVIDPQGNTLDLEGDVQFLRAVSLDGSVEIASSALYGGFAWDGAGTDWVTDAERHSVTVGLTQFRVPAVGGRAFAATGSVNVVVDGVTTAVRFLDTFMADEIVGARCGTEPGGVVEVRDPYGRWVTVTFHGPVLELSEGDPARCDGCGDAESDGVALGEVCADFTPWFAEVL